MISMNLPVLEVPQLVIRASIVFKHDGGEVLSSSKCSDSAVSLKFDPNDPISITINDEDLLNKLEASLVFMDNVPVGNLFPNSEIVTVFIEVLFGRLVLDGVATVVIALDDPLKNDRLVDAAKLPNKQFQRRTRC